MPPKSLVLLIIPVLQVLSCDHTKHYTNDRGECCDKCGPGTRMSSTTTCKDPTCTPCKDDEYQQYYTKEVKCNRHPYCDPNLHMESTLPITKEHISECRCMKGYHCDGQRCSTCIKNTPCKPGQKENETSGLCELEDAETSQHTGLYVLGAIVFVILLCIGFGYCWTKGKCQGLKGAQDNCADLWKKKIRENKPLKNEEDIEAQKDDEPLQRLVAEENEVKDEETISPVQEVSSDNHIDCEVRSEGGQPIQQEQGKEDILSQTESCSSTQTTHL